VYGQRARRGFTHSQVCRAGGGTVIEEEGLRNAEGSGGWISMQSYVFVGLRMRYANARVKGGGMVLLRVPHWH